jgi:hypothetical protein
VDDERDRMISCQRPGGGRTSEIMPSRRKKVHEEEGRRVAQSPISCDGSRDSVISQNTYDIHT